MDEQLTTQDYHLLMLLAGGRSGVETAAALGVGVPDLARRLVEVRHVLGVTSTRAAIAVALGQHQV